MIHLLSNNSQNPRGLRAMKSVDTRIRNSSVGVQKCTRARSEFCWWVKILASSSISWPDICVPRRTSFDKSYIVYIITVGEWFFFLYVLRSHDSRRLLYRQRIRSLLVRNRLSRVTYTAYRVCACSIMDDESCNDMVLYFSYTLFQVHAQYIQTKQNKALCLFIYVCLFVCPPVTQAH